MSDSTQQTFTPESVKRLNAALAERMGVQSEDVIGGFSIEHNGGPTVTVTCEIVQVWDHKEFAEWWNAMRLEVMQ